MRRVPSRTDLAAEIGNPIVDPSVRMIDKPKDATIDLVESTVPAQLPFGSGVRAATHGSGFPLGPGALAVRP